MTLSVRVDAKLKARLRRSAASIGTSTSDFVRQAIEEKLVREEAKRPKKTPYELGKHLFGRYASGRSDTSERAEELIGEYLSEKHRRRSR
jgi:hypothetical protein